MIRKYVPEDFVYLDKWVTDPFTLFRFAGPSWSYPLTEKQVLDHQEIYPDKQLYIGLDEAGIPFAIGEIILHEPHSPRLGRLLVGDPSKRGLGLGSRFIRDLIEECLKIFPTRHICLFVLRDNQGAIHTYAKLGFMVSPEEIPDMLYNGHAYPVYKMVMELYPGAGMPGVGLINNTTV